ncbi:MAG: 50S ribosomal protein L21 [Planctomycetaceae bacterium]|jgi:large subunit ribosomal protein L21|nr:50S ribosomal protein L21 [Planctomycetaceae bacterium]
MTYAIIKDGSRQIKVAVDKRIQIDYRGDQEPGTVIELPEVLAVGDGSGVKIGQPTLAGAKVVTEVISDFKGPKLTVAKFRRRKNSKRRTGHRQIYTLVLVKEIIS